MPLTKPICEAIDEAIKTFPAQYATKTKPGWCKGELIESNNRYDWEEDQEIILPANYCAIGWLAHCAGFDDEEIAESTTLDMIEDLGLDPDLGATVVEANDTAETRRGPLNALRKLKTQVCG